MAANSYTSRFARGAAPQLVKQEPGELAEYEPFKEVIGQQRRPRFEVVTESGELHGFAWSYLGEWSFHPRGFLTFGTSGSIVTVEGRGLERLHELFLSEKLAALHAFRRGLHIEPPEDAPKVTRIEVRGRFERPEADG